MGAGSERCGSLLFLVTTVHFEFHSVYCLLNYENLEFIIFTLVKRRLAEELSINFCVSVLV